MRDLSQFITNRRSSVNLWIQRNSGYSGRVRVGICVEKFSIVSIYIGPKFKIRDAPMYIRPKVERTTGLKKRSNVHQPEISKDVGAAADDGAVAADPDLDGTVTTLPERPHRPWLVPGVGRL